MLTLTEITSIDVLGDQATDIDEVADNWIARYGKDNVEALRELVNFMIRVRIWWLLYGGEVKVTFDY